MAVQIATKVIDGDGHLLDVEDEGIIAHMEGAYREISAPRVGNILPPLDHLHSGRTVETPPMRNHRPFVGPKEWARLSRHGRHLLDGPLPDRALAYGKIVSLDYAVAFCRAYNDWVHERYLKADPRFKAMALIPMQDPPEAAKELRRAVTELGMLGAMLPTNGLPQPLGAKTYWPVYEEANRLGCPLSIHGGCHDRFGMDHMNMFVPVHALGHPWGLAVNFGNILYNGIYERFPRVRIAFLEGGVAWILLLLERLHASHETHYQYMPPGQLGVREEEDPAKRIKTLIEQDRFYLGIETEELTMPFALKIVGNKPFLYSSDFPHEVTLESCKRDIEELMESDAMTEDDKTAILSRNAERFYTIAP